MFIWKGYLLLIFGEKSNGLKVVTIRYSSKLSLEHMFKSVLGQIDKKVDFTIAPKLRGDDWLTGYGISGKPYFIKATKWVWIPYFNEIEKYCFGLTLSDTFIKCNVS